MQESPSRAKESSWTLYPSSLTGAVKRGALISLLLAAGSAATFAQPPNIVMILADDIGFGDLGVYGHPYARTPSLDRLAREGTRFNQFYVGGITCNPSRTAFMTGRYPARFASHTAENGFGDHITLTELLANQGYRTGHFGKWHIGPVTTIGTYGIEELHAMGGRRSDPNGRDEPIFTAAIDFIRRNRNTPFYVNIWGRIAHMPINPPAKLYRSFPEFAFARADFGSWSQENFDKSQFLIEKYSLTDNLATAMRKYLSEIRALDAQVGRLLDELDRLDLTENTIVIFSSDQGAEPVFLGMSGYERGVEMPNASKNLLGYAGGLRGSKHTVYEGGVRSPLIVRWPGQVPAGRVNRTSIISATDLLPTLARVAQVDIAQGVEADLDGEDTLDIWRGNGRSRSQPLFWRSFDPNGPVTMRRGDWKITRSGNNKYELFNVALDPFEETDQAISRQDVITELDPLLTAWVQALPASYELERVGSPRRPRAHAGRDRVVHDTDGDGRATFRLDGTRSSDPDGSIAAYVWKLDEQRLAVGRNPLVELPLGEHVVTLIVSDYRKKKARDRVRISVVP